MCTTNQLWVFLALIQRDSSQPGFAARQSDPAGAAAAGKFSFSQWIEDPEVLLKMRCLQAEGSKVINVDQLYDAGAAEGNLWESPGVTPLCSSVSPPPPSRCLVCIQETAYAVCHNVTSDLIMEGDGRTIPIRESGCPDFMEPGEKPLNTNWTGFPTASEHLWWLIVIPIIIFIICVLVYRQRKGIRRAWQKCRAEEPDAAANL